tara:strand:+ start:8426 stop:9262 length:837 start_codon:yes stop_codon:yes gene_type:complete
MREQHELLKFIKGREEQKFVLVTITDTEGSTYRKKGSKKLIAANGTSVGLISGGCLESEIIEQALKMEGKSFSCVIDTTSELDRVFGYSIGCQGKIYLNFEKLKGKDLFSKKEFQPDLEETLDIFVFGAGPDILPLKELLDWMRWRVTFYTHRSDQFEEKKRLNWNINKIDPFSFEVSIPCPERTALLLMSHNYPSDLELLRYFLNYPIGYIGILGPHQKREQMLKDLKNVYNTDISGESLSKIYGPMGIKNLGRGESAIALSIVSQLQSIFFNKEGH